MTAFFEWGPAGLRETILRGPSGEELAGKGFGSDVLVATEVDADAVVPDMENGRFVPWREGVNGWER